MLGSERENNSPSKKKKKKKNQHTYSTYRTLTQEFGVFQEQKENDMARI